eukprot:364591-Chlamydomonas_euryale.AAC.5
MSSTDLRAPSQLARASCGPRARRLLSVGQLPATAASEPDSPRMLPLPPPHLLRDCHTQQGGERKKGSAAVGTPRHLSLPESGDRGHGASLQRCGSTAAPQGGAMPAAG